MPTMRTFAVTLLPAHRTPDGHLGYTKDPGATYPEKTFQAATVSGAVRAAEDFARRHGAPCFARLTCRDRPKPPGFAKATRNLFCNIDVAPRGKH